MGPRKVLLVLKTRLFFHFLTVSTTFIVSVKGRQRIRLLRPNPDNVRDFFVVKVFLPKKSAKWLFLIYYTRVQILEFSRYSIIDFAIRVEFPGAHSRTTKPRTSGLGIVGGLLGCIAFKASGLYLARGGLRANIGLEQNIQYYRTKVSFYFTPLC